MSVNLYCPPTAGQQSADLLCEKMPAERLRGVKPLVAGDKLICWGYSYLVSRLRDLDGVACLNRRVKSSEKYQQARLLREAGVPTIEVATRPRNGWLGRRQYHEDGHDFTDNDFCPDFYVKREEIAEEFRLHSFLGKSIRFGRKVHREDDQWERSQATPSSWIRSWHTGWTLEHGEWTSTPEMRSISHAAVKALDLDFGAVDLAVLESGKVIVLEVNRAPGLWGFTRTAEVYMENFKRWAEVR